LLTGGAAGAPGGAAAPRKRAAVASGPLAAAEAFPYVMHWAALAVFALCLMHVQVCAVTARACVRLYKRGRACVRVCVLVVEVV
jgi:hypothetical protein